MDTWVFEKVKELFSAASNNATLDAVLRQDKNIFFLHLLGLDTTGHAYRPYSKEYLHNIKVVDRGVKEITALISNYYDDGKTAFVFTADHGMTDWGSHGDGHPDSTRTPLIAWGSGVAKPVIVAHGKAPGHEDGFSSDWGLDQVQRHDVAQADIAALMAYLAGLEFPVNSVGELPLPYLVGDPKEKAEAALANAKSLLEMYRVKEEQKRATQLRYKPYHQLADRRHSIDKRIREIEVAISQGHFDTSIKISKELLHLGLDGLRYLQTYDWLFLRTLVTIGYLGWIAFALTTVIDMHVLQGQVQISKIGLTSATYLALATLFASFLWLRKAPLTYYAYAIFPLTFWKAVFARQEVLLRGIKVLFAGRRRKEGVIMLGVKAIAFIGVLELIVSAFLLSG